MVVVVAVVVVVVAAAAVVVVVVVVAAAAVVVVVEVEVETHSSWTCGLANHGCRVKDLTTVLTITAHKKNIANRHGTFKAIPDSSLGSDSERQTAPAHDVN